MTRSLPLQIAVAFILSAFCMVAAYLHAPFYGWLAACFLGFGVFRSMEGPGPGRYKLEKHLYGLGAWLVLFTALFYPPSWTYSERERVGGTYVSCLSVGTPRECAEAIDTLHGPMAMTFLRISGIDWRDAVSACRTGSQYASCLKGLLDQGNDVGDVFKSGDIAALCADSSDKTACYLDLQKKGLDFSGMKLSWEVSPHVAGRG